MKNFENLNEPKFNQLDVEKMKRLKGGYTTDTVTCYGNGRSGTDGSASDDGCSND